MTNSPMMAWCENVRFDLQWAGVQAQLAADRLEVSSSDLRTMAVIAAVVIIGLAIIRRKKND